MNEAEEKAYAEGQAALARSIMRNVTPYLPEHPDRDAISAETERAEAIAALRDICAVFGDNNWPDELHLADIIRKHLRRHLQDE